MSAATRMCHIFPSFEAGGAEVRTVGIINQLGPEFHHTIIATDDRWTAGGRLASDACVSFVKAPPGKGSLFFGFAFRSLLRTLRPSVVATYNWGAIDAVIGARLASICRVVHAEDGFGSDEAAGLKRRRVLARRFLLRHVFATVVPSRTLLNIAVREYRLPADRIRYIPNGVDLGRFRPGANPAWRSELGIPHNAVLFGFVGALRPEKRLDHLLKAFAQSGLQNAWLVIVGDGPCRGELERLADALGIRERVVFAGTLNDPAAAYNALDIFAMSSMTEQMPISLLEAMASGLPVVCTDVGDIRDVLGETAAQAVVPRDDTDGYRRLLVDLGADRSLRLSLGERNRVRCERLFSQQRMMAEYRRLYLEASVYRPEFRMVPSW